MTTFRSEAALARTGRRLVREAIDTACASDTKVRYEVPAPGGVPDLVMYRRDKNTVLYVVTIEFKLENWRRALGQAFRHRNFGNEAYVVIDGSRLQSMSGRVRAFRQANVGLILLDTSGNAEVLVYPEPKLPFSVRFSENLATSLLPRRSLPHDLLFTRTVRGGVGLLGLREFLGPPVSA